MITLFPYLVFGAVAFIVGFGSALALVLLYAILRHLKQPSRAEVRPADWDQALTDLLDQERRR